MSLATRCTACSTVFRVVEDQLKVSQGWVRCGRCNEVFDAQAHLVEVPPPRPPAAAAPVTPVLAKAEEVATIVRDEPAQGFVEPTTDRAMPQAQSPLDAKPAEPERELEPERSTDTKHEPAPASDVKAEPEATNAETRGLTGDRAQAPASASAESEPPSEQPQPAQADLRGDSVVPAFIRKADRAARWQHKHMRATLAVAALGLALLLTAQLAVSQRDWLATRWPQSRPWLDELCQPLGCRVQALRRVDQINVAASGLTRIEGSPLYRFNMVLLNRGDITLMMPAIDLSLTDAQGQVITRRVLSASELGVQSAVVSPGTELPLQAMLSTGSRRVAGYTIELFYP